MISVLVVEDSPVVRELLVYLLDAEPDIEVVATASDGEMAIEAVQRLRPDIVTMDLHMPKLDGLDATRRIMESTPTPIVILSGATDPGDIAKALCAMEAGAQAALPRPAGIGHPDHDRTVEDLLRTLRAIAGAKAVPYPSPAPHPEQPIEATAPDIAVVALGASTGGPVLLKTILSALPADFAVPLVIVQRMAPGFVRGLGEWLAQRSPLPVRLAVDGDQLAAGTVYLAPDGYQMTLEKGGGIRLDPCDSGAQPCPSVAALFHSLATAYGSGAMAGLLSGMGEDGAGELKWLRDQGAFTFVQDEGTCVVADMPRAAMARDAAMAALAPEDMAPLLIQMACQAYRQQGG